MSDSLLASTGPAATAVAPSAGIGQRRALFLALCLATAGAMATGFYAILAAGGWSWAEIAIFAVYLPTLPWTVIGFWNAFIGFLLLHVARDPLRQVLPAAANVPAGDPITTRTAILFAVRHEELGPIEARIRVMLAELEAAGVADRFDVHVLSDSARAESTAAEEAMIARLAGVATRPGQISYRRRTENSGFKAGNLREFYDRAGHSYDFTLPLDADSLMSAWAILRLVRVMQRNPRIGILQSLVVGLPAESFFTRVFQFGMRHGMRSYTMGSAWWQGDCGPYWGHNALIRSAAFTDHCRLPMLPGQAPLGGHVLSHDQVEAVLMRRAGFEVRVLPVEGGSWEENPPALPDFVKRDLRWCQGNMQYFRLLGLPGLKGVSRLQLALAIQMYIGAPCWMAMVVLGAIQPFLPAQSAPPPTGLGLALFGAAIFMTFSPKIFGLLDVLMSQASRRDYGGTGRLLAGGLTDILFSCLVGPMMALCETIFMLGLLFGRKVGWEAQKRDGYAVPLGEALRGLWPQTLFGAAITAALAIGAPGALAFAAPFLMAMLLAAPFAVGTAAPALGRLATRVGLCAIPDELRPEPAVAALRARL
jgi:membrane glycosyltransferase